MTDYTYPLDIYIGYDEGEAVAYHACVNSLIRHASQPLRITPLALNNLAPVYVERHPPASTSFAYSRFLVPYLSNFTGMSLFLDGDMIVMDDVAKLFDESKNHLGAAVWCVQHPEYKPRSSKKFRDAPQVAYPKKNWSSVMLFRNSSSFCKQLTPEYVTKATGKHLHQFEWVPETRIGELPSEWNLLVGEQKKRDDAKLLHYTEGVPAFAAYSVCDYANVWFDELHRMTSVDDL